MPINKALAEYLDLYHKGEANAVTSRELECAFRMRGSELRREINALRGDGIPICSFDGGYYHDICFPCTKEARQQFNDAVLNAYEQSLRQAQQPDNAPAAEQVM